MELSLEDEDFVLRFRARVRKQTELKGISIEDFWRGKGKVFNKNAFDVKEEECFIREFLIGWDDNLEGLDNCFHVNSGLGHKHVIERVSSILGLASVDEIDTEAIAKINIDRWKNYHNLLSLVLCSVINV